jgi:hypothetical protein
MADDIKARIMKINSLSDVIDFHASLMEQLFIIIDGHFKDDDVGTKSTILSLARTFNNQKLSVFIEKLTEIIKKYVPNILNKKYAFITNTDFSENYKDADKSDKQLIIKIFKLLSQQWDTINIDIKDRIFINLKHQIETCVRYKQLS